MQGSINETGSLRTASRTTHSCLLFQTLDQQSDAEHYRAMFAGQQMNSTRSRHLIPYPHILTGGIMQIFDKLMRQKRCMDFLDAFHHHACEDSRSTAAGIGQ